MVSRVTPRTVKPDRDDPAMQCPLHDREMRRFAIDTIEVDRCGICGGIWLDAGELARLVALDTEGKSAIKLLDRSDGDDEPGDHGPVCPRDGATLEWMQTDTRARFECGVCHTCGGVFLNSGELSTLTAMGLIEKLRRSLFPTKR